MRKLLVVVAALAAAACGGSSKSGPSNTVSGTIGGAAFTPVDVEALTLGPATCSLTGVPGTVGAAGVAIEFASTPNVCADLTSATCVAHPNSAGVTVFIASAAILGGTAALAKTTYTVVANPASGFVPGANNSVQVAFAESHRLGASCHPPSATPVTATGTVTLTDASATHLAGHVDLTFSDGGNLQGDFSVPTCGAVPASTICDLANAAIAGQPVSLCTGFNCQ
jgi:hypothetical protein